MAFAHFPPGPIFQFLDELRPTVDGDLSDWDIVPEAYTIPIDLVGERPGYATWTTEDPGFTFDGTLNGPGTTAWDGMIYYGPESTEHKFKEDEIIGLQFSYGDFDDPENPKQYHAFWTVSRQDATFKFAERFCDFLVAPSEPGLAVEANTWDRIKASFE